MAYAGKIICNPVTRQEIRFIQTARDTRGALLEMESTYHGHSREPLAHYHPYQEEDFTVLGGELTVKIDQVLRVLRPGDTLHIPANTVHAMWNASAGETVVNWRVRPAMDTEYLLETATGLAAAGKTNEQGTPPLLQTVLLADRFGSVFRLARPPYAVLKMLATLLKPLARRRGYQPTYEQYLD